MTAAADECAERVRVMAEAARAAARMLAATDAATRDLALCSAARAIRAAEGAILEANAQDLARTPQTRETRASFRDRLMLDPDRIEAMAQGLEAIAALPDPLAREMGEWTRPNGLRIRRIPQPIGVIGIIYESRPNVGADAAGLCVKAGSAVILRSGSESFESAGAIGRAVTDGLTAAGLPAAAVANAPMAAREFVGAMLAAAGQIDLIVPRGGRALVERVAREARMPVLAHAEGLCHTYVHRAADAAMARRVVANAKMRRPGVCGATETLLIDAAIAPGLLGLITADLAALGCRFRADPRARAIVPTLAAAEDGDFDTEWLDAVLSIAVVDDLAAALAHIARHGSSHTDAIITGDQAAAAAFFRGVDSAVALCNASTQFCDGGEFGFGAEIGIATGRVHARGPVGLEQLTSYRYLVSGSGQVRP
ncbi:MAG: glutamate-5-semialdehyde dehydrogenase [Acetobacteraceae bacterium]